MTGPREPHLQTHIVPHSTRYVRIPSTFRIYGNNMENHMHICRRRPTVCTRKRSTCSLETSMACRQGRGSREEHENLEPLEALPRF